jgi:hypothetical protein
MGEDDVGVLGPAADETALPGDHEVLRIGRSGMESSRKLTVVEAGY